MTNKPEMKQVDSSMVAAIGYDFDNSILWVEYKGGKFYTYAGVDVATWGVMDDPGGMSIGRYINAFIKPNYAATKVEG